MSDFKYRDDVQRHLMTVDALWNMGMDFTGTQKVKVEGQEGLQQLPLPRSEIVRIVEKVVSDPADYMPEGWPEAWNNV